MGIDVIKRLNWDSECFGYEVGTVSIGSNALEYSKFFKEAGSYQLVYIFSKTSLIGLPSSIRKVDEKITLKKELQPSSFGVRGGGDPVERDDPSGAVGDFGIIDFADIPLDDIEKDLDDLALISGKYSRFKTDRRLNNQEFERLYQTWVRKALVEDDKGWAFVKEGQARGMITLTTTQTGTFKISLLAVHPSTRNQGVGRALISKALTTGINSGSRTLLVTTQRANIAAMALYQKAGFEVTDACHVYHWWKG